MAVAALRRIVQKEYRDIDGYWIEFVPGWRTCDEGTHGVVEDTRRQAREKALALAEPCDCGECRELLARVRQ